METLKTLWYIRKVKVYESLIRKMTAARAKLKSKQLGFRERYEHYKKIVDERTKV